jgi:hypothetical protein
MNRLLPLLFVSLLASASAEAACVNQFLARADGSRQVITFLTGKLTFDEAQKLASAISRREANGVEWVDDRGRSLSKQVGELKVVRPMPVGCDGKTSGVVVIATFGTNRTPAKKMLVRFDPQTTVTFDEQAQ